MSVAMTVAFGVGALTTSSIAVANELLHVSKQTSDADKKIAIQKGFVLSTLPATVAAVGAGAALLSNRPALGFTLGAAALGAALGQILGGAASIAIAKD